MPRTIPVASSEQTSARERCSWCGDRVERDDGFRLFEEPGERRAAFCRLEHVVPWTMQGPHWEAGEAEEPSSVGHGLDSCAHCGAALDDVRVVLVRHRGEHRIADAFCSVEHASDWAKAGGRWR
jgi:hypothetical protein